MLTHRKPINVLKLLMTSVDLKYPVKVFPLVWHKESEEKVPPYAGLVLTSGRDFTEYNKRAPRYSP